MFDIIALVVSLGAAAVAAVSFVKTRGLAERVAAMELAARAERKRRELRAKVKPEAAPLGRGGTFKRKRPRWTDAKNRPGYK